MSGIRSETRVFYAVPALDRTKVCALVINPLHHVRVEYACDPDDESVMLRGHGVELTEMDIAQLHIMLRVRQEMWDRENCSLQDLALKVWNEEADAGMSVDWRMMKVADAIKERVLRDAQKD